MGQYTVNPGQIAKAAIKRDVKRMEAGRLGLSDQEKHQATMAGEAAAAQQAAALQRNVARAGMQGGPSGANIAAQRGIAQQAATAGAMSRAATDDLSSRLAEARRQEVLARVDQQRRYKREDYGKLLTAAGSGAETAGSILGGAAPGGQ